MKVQNRELHQRNLKLLLQKLAAFDKIHIIGLMTMAPHTEDTELIRSVFRTMKNLRDRIDVTKITSCTVYRIIDGNVE